VAANLVLLTLLGCGRGPEQSASILVLTAASTREAVQEVAASFTHETGVAVQLNADDSSKLATQIVQGAPADLFLSASQTWTEYVQKHGLAQDIKPLLGNDLVLIVPRGNPLKLTGPNDLTGPAVKRIALAGPTVPAGTYARQALRHLHLLDDLETQKKIVTGENVRITLAYVEQGEVDAGIVYATDAIITDKVETVARFPSSSHDRIVYPLVLLQSAQKNKQARKFYDYLQGQPAAAIFRKHGFAWLDGN
jgi:molybdate transport system substrate-binding protein